MKHLTTLILTLFIGIMGASAQQARTVSGTVTDKGGAPVVGVTVVVEGTTLGTVTDVNGKYTLNVPATGKTLRFSSIGMKPVELAVASGNFNVTMEDDTTLVEDVVVIGYGTVKRGDLTGSVASVSAKVLENAPVASAAEAIMGRMAGVQVTTNDGSPDADVRIRVRGGGSMTQDNSPLYIVDGFEVSNINDVSPNDIQSIDVLKDASSTAIYGARGANGVLIVTTKAAKAGKTTVSFNSFLQWRQLSNRLEMLSPYEFVTLNYEIESIAKRQTNFIKRYGDPGDYYIYKGQEGNDWQDLLYGSTPLSQMYNLSISGGSEKTKFNLSYNRNDDKGVLKNSGYVRNTVNFKLNYQMYKNLKLDLSARYSQTETMGAGTDEKSGTGLTKSLQYRPTNGLSDYSYSTDDGSDDEATQTDVYPPTEDVKQNYRQRLKNLFNATGALTWKINKRLTWRTEMGTEVYFFEDNRFYGPQTYTARDKHQSLPLTQVTRTRSPKYKMTNTLTWAKTFDCSGLKHDFNVMAGQEVISQTQYTYFTEVDQFPIDATPKKAFAVATDGIPKQVTSSEPAPDRLASFFGRVNYTLNDKYLLTATLRADGSSKFAPGNQWGYFPSAAFAWKVSDENFLRDNKTVSNLKLRLSYGEAGNNRIPDDAWRYLYKLSSARPVQFGSKAQPYYLHDGAAPNPDVTWETTVTRNAGIDFGFFGNRLSGTIDAYWNTTRDLLVPVKILPTSGYEKMYANAGKTSNRGVELSLNGYIVDRSNFTLNANLNVGYNKSRVDALSAGYSPWALASGWASTELRQLYDYRMIVGQQMNLIYGYVTDGFYQVSDFDFNPATGAYTLKADVVDCTSIVGTLRPGSLKLKKLGGDGLLVNADEDCTTIGNTNPKFSGGFGFNGTIYKNFDFSVFFTYMYGFDVYNANKVKMSTTWKYTNLNMLSIMDSKHRFRYYDDAGNSLLEDPTALADFNANATIWSPIMDRPIIHSWAIEDGSFLRLSNVTVGYTLPAKLTMKAGISKLRVYATGYNLMTWTGYSGYDPEVQIQQFNEDSGVYPNLDYNVYPKSRSWSVGINITF